MKECSKSKFFVFKFDPSEIGQLSGRRNGCGSLEKRLKKLKFSQSANMLKMIEIHYFWKLINLWRIIQIIKINLKLTVFFQNYLKSWFFHDFFGLWLNSPYWFSGGNRFQNSLDRFVWHFIFWKFLVFYFCLMAEIRFGLYSFDYLLLGGVMAPFLRVILFSNQIRSAWFMPFPKVKTKQAAG